MDTTELEMVCCVLFGCLRYTLQSLQWTKGNYNYLRVIKYPRVIIDNESRVIINNYWTLTSSSLVILLWDVFKSVLSGTSELEPVFCRPSSQARLGLLDWTWVHGRPFHDVVGLTSKESQTAEQMIGVKVIVSGMSWLPSINGGSKWRHDIIYKSI